MLLFTFSCEEKESGDVTAPGKLTINSITPTNGGGIISYTLPDDNDILFVILSRKRRGGDLYTFNFSASTC